MRKTTQNTPEKTKCLMLICALPGVLTALWLFGFITLSWPLAFFESVVAQAGSQSDGRAGAEAAHQAHLQEHRDSFQHVTQFMPSYSVAKGQSTSLFLMNMFADPILVRVVAYNVKGDQFVVAEQYVGPSSHWELSLNTSLATAGPSFREGSVSIEYQGEVDLIGAWALVRQGSKAFEIPFTHPAKFRSSRLSSFWDTESLNSKEETSPTFVLLNTSATPVKYFTTITANSGRQKRESKTLAPYNIEVLTPAKGNRDFAVGSLSIEHTGQPGSLIASGVLAGQSLGPLLVIDPATLTSTALETVRLPLQSHDATGATVPMTGLLTLFNTTAQPQNAEITLSDSRSGEQLLKTTRTLSAGEVETLDLTSELGEAVKDLSDGNARLSVEHTGAPGSLLLLARSLGEDGQSISLPFFERVKAHHNGLYPLPSLDRHEVVATLVNLGDEPANVVAQVNWEGGVYALPPVSIAAGASGCTT